MKSLLIFICITVLFLTGCKEEKTVIVPADISSVSTTTLPGSITLHWDVPTDSATIRYVKVNYYDPRLKRDVMKTTSVYTDSVLIEDTRQKYGDYTFTVQSVSPSGNEGTPQEVKVTSLPAIPVYEMGQFPLTAAMLSSESQEPSEGPIANLVDGATTNFFHTAWSISSTAPHSFQIDFGQEIDGQFRIWYANRNNAGNKPTDFDIMGSTDGTTWSLVRNFTQAADELNVASSGEWMSKNYPIPSPFRYMKFVVNKTNTNTVFFTMSEFRFYYPTRFVDPESSDEE